MPKSGAVGGAGRWNRYAATRTLPNSNKLTTTAAAPQVDRRYGKPERRNGRVWQMYQGDRQAKA